MLERFMPREEKFFDLFIKSSELIVEGARAFHHMLSDLKNSETHAKEIKFIEHQADEVTHKTVDLLHKTFITPLDREDIYALISKMDDVIDYIEAGSQRFPLYDIRTATPELITLSEICCKSAESIQKAVQLLHNIKKPEEIIRHCVEINRLENEADTVLRGAMGKLFREETDTRQLIKLKEVYEVLETVTDRCEDVANVIEGIVVEYS